MDDLQMRVMWTVALLMGAGGVALVWLLVIAISIDIVRMTFRVCGG